MFGLFKKKPKFSASRGKFNNVKVETTDGIFDSKAEYARWEELKILQKGKQIRNLRRQIPYSIVINGSKVCDYIADHVYTDMQTGKEVVEDVKGFATETYKLKKKLMKAVRGIDIYEFKPPRKR